MALRLSIMATRGGIGRPVREHSRVTWASLDFLSIFITFKQSNYNKITARKKL